VKRKQDFFGTGVHKNRSFHVASFFFPSYVRACVDTYDVCFHVGVLSECRWMEKETGGVRVRERVRKGHQLDDEGM